MGVRGIRWICLTNNVAHKEVGPDGKEQLHAKDEDHIEGKEHVDKSLKPAGRARRGTISQ